MKKYILFIIAISGALASSAQVGRGTLGDLAAFRPALQLSGNIMYGSWKPDFTATSLAAPYPNTVNTTVSDLKFSKGSAMGINLQAGYFFGYTRHFGIGTGILFLRHKGNYSVDNFHVEYQSIDSRGEVFRQIINSRRVINEKVTATNFSIPIVGKYQTYFTEKIGFNLDAGLLLNVQMQNSYETNALFDYEAVYKYDIIGDDVKAVYDNSTNPSSNSWLITRSSFLKKNPKGNLNSYFEQQRSQGYNVGSAITPESKSGKRPYKSGAIGFLIQPSINYAISEEFMVNIGGYYMMQFFSNEQQNTKLTDIVGSYNSVLDAVDKSKSASYGISVGVKYYLSFGKEELNR